MPALSIAQPVERVAQSQTALAGAEEHQPAHSTRTRPSGSTTTPHAARNCPLYDPGMNGARKPKRVWRLASVGGRAGAMVLGLAWPLTLLGGVTLALPGGLRVAAYGGSLNVQHLSANASQSAAVHMYGNKVGAVWLLPEFSVYPVGAFGAGFAGFEAIIPFWMPALMCAAVGAVGVWKCRTLLVGVCRHCRYNLDGLPDAAVCPECGRHIAPAHTAE